MMRTNATVLAVTSGAASAEQLARVAVSVSGDGRDITGILVADPDSTDRTTGRLPQLTEMPRRRQSGHRQPGHRSQRPDGPSGTTENRYVTQSPPVASTAGLRIMQVHNWYRSATPSGENRVVEREGAALTERGHEVVRFDRHSDEIEQWSAPRKAALPGQIVWSRGARRDLRARLRADAARRGARPQHLPAAQPIGPARLPGRGRAGRDHRAQLPPDVRWRQLLQGRRDLP